MSEADQITIGEYLLERLVQLETTCIFAVPGDFNLFMLDLVEDHEKIKYIGMVAELNAAYSADGYARIKNRLGVVCTTFGVGELSACAAIAGSFSERVPVLHLVGVPSTKLQAHKAIMHHTLGDGRFDAFVGIASHITAAQAFLLSTTSNANGASAAEEIDRVLRTAILQCRPTYLTLPTDLVSAKIPRKPLETPLTYQSLIKELAHPPLPPGLKSHVLEAVISLYNKAEKPIFIIDACAVRFNVIDQVLKLIEATNIPFCTTPMAKSAISEHHPQFAGVYIGSVSLEEVSKLVEQADLAINIGSLKSDFNTGSFSYRIKTEQQIELHSDHVMMQYARYDGLGFHAILPELTEAIKKVPHKQNGLQGIKLGHLQSRTPSEDHKLVQDEFWPQIAQHLQSGDVCMTETGTSSFGMLDALLPDNVLLHSQVLWGAIGFAGGASVGATVAASELGRRFLLFTGEGSYQITIQDVSQFIRLNLHPVIVVLNNKGYVIERQIHGSNRKYNDVPAWRWQNTLEYFGAEQGTTRSYSVSTVKELTEVLGTKVPEHPDKLQLVEVHLGPHDVPRALRIQADLSEKANAE